jgi:hypothetical protein
VPAQSKNNQVEPHPLKRLLEIPEAIPDRQERLFVKLAETSQIRETNPVPQRKVVD